MAKDLIICGVNACKEAFKMESIAKVYVTKDKEREFAKLIKLQNISYVVVDKKFLDKLTENSTHQGVALVVSPIKYLTLDELITKTKKNPLFLMLDEVQDVNNMGAIIRNADCFEIDGIIINKKRNAQITASVAKVAAGALKHVNICRVTNLDQSITKLKAHGFWVAGLHMQGSKQLQEEVFDLPLVVVIGGEDKGITPVMSKKCDYTLTIPMNGHVNSLNVASATAILCYTKFINEH